MRGFERGALSGPKNISGMERLCRLCRLSRAFVSFRMVSKT